MFSFFSLEKRKARKLRGQYSIEFTAMLAIAILLLVITSLFHYNENAFLFNEASFLEARALAERAAILVNTAASTPGYSTVFLTPASVNGLDFVFNASNYSVYVSWSNATRYYASAVRVNSLECGVCPITNSSFFRIRNDGNVVKIEYA